MTITAAIVLFATIWFLVLFLCLQIRIETQADIGERVEGTHSSSPVNFSMKKRLQLATLISLPIWGLVMGIILSGFLSIEMLDLFSPIGDRP